MSERRFFIEADLNERNDVVGVDAFAEVDGVRIAGPDFNRPLTRLTEAEKRRRGLDRLIEDILDIERFQDNDPIEC
jgi:hypothetical protein